MNINCYSDSNARKFSPSEESRGRRKQEALKLHLDGFNQILWGAEASPAERTILQGEVSLEERTA